MTTRPEDLNFDHIGVVVSDLKTGDEVLCTLFPIVGASEIYIDPLINVKVVFLTDSAGIRYELISPLNDKSPLNSVLKTRKDVINHVAYTTTRFDEAIEYYKSAGCLALGEPTPAVAFDNNRVIFFITSIGAIIEIVEAKS